MKSILFGAAKVNVPNGAAFAFIRAAEVKGWLEVALVATSIICTIMVTRAEIRRRGRP